MKLTELIRISNHNLFRSKLRTLLPVLAIFVGAFTLVLTNGLGDGLRDCVFCRSFTRSAREPFEAD